MKIVFLTQYFPPEVGAPQTRIFELSKRFVERGHEVTVLTGMPNYPTGKTYDGYGGIRSVEHLEGIRVIRTYLYPTTRVDYVRRLANYFSFVISSASLGSVMLSRCDYVVVESPPLFLGLSGLWLSWLKGARMIFNVSDLWPESAVRVGVLSRESAAFKAAEKLEGLLYRRAWQVSGQSKTILESVAKRFPNTSTYHLSNGVDTKRFTPARADQVTRKMLSPNGECTIVYAGLHGLAQGLDQVLHAAKLLNPVSNCRFVFVGDGPEKHHLLEEARTLGLTNVLFLDPRPSEEMPALVASADIVIVPLKTLIPGAVPSKLYESMAAGKPVLFVADGEGADIVRRYKAGLVITPGDVEGIKNAVLRLSEDPKMRFSFGVGGRLGAQQDFDRSIIADKFIDHLEAAK